MDPTPHASPPDPKNQGGSKDHRAIVQANKLRTEQVVDALRYGTDMPHSKALGAGMLYISAMCGLVGIVGTIAIASIIHWIN